MFGVERSQSRRLKRAWEILEMLGLEGLAHKQPQLLSGGERQRVAVGRAFANHPSLVFADEPTGNLDTASSNRVVEALLDMAGQTRGALIVVTHNAAVAERMDRTLEIVDGHIADPVVNS
jgi:ABC-type lipoprotein export system ATPase subunit